MSRWTRAGAVARGIGRIAGLFGLKFRGVPVNTIADGIEQEVRTARKRNKKPPKAKAKQARGSPGD